MKIRLVSDLHIDVNEYDFEFEPSDLLVVAGDIAGSWRRESKWLRNQDDFVAVGGNHLGYDHSFEILIDTHLTKDDTKEYSLKSLQSEFSTYLNNTYIKRDNYIIYGGTMYTDFLLYGKKHAPVCKWTAERWLNDFRTVNTYCNRMIRRVEARDYVKWHKQFIKGLNQCLEETTEDVIVVTHFAPSIKSIESKYLNRENRLSSPGRELNAAYATPMEDFILSNPRIKLWAHGHVHSKFDYMIGDCRVVCCPYGYYHYDTELDPTEYQGMLIELP